MCCMLISYSIFNISITSNAASYSPKVWDKFRNNFYYQSRVLVGGREKYRIGNKNFYMDNITYSSYSRYISAYENAINECNSHCDKIDLALISTGLAASISIKTGGLKTTAGRVSALATALVGSSVLVEYYEANDCYCVASQNFNKLHAALGYSNK